MKCRYETFFGHDTIDLEVLYTDDQSSSRSLAEDIYPNVVNTLLYSMN